MNRRAFHVALAAGCAGVASAADAPPPVRAITRGPKFHWRGYYDKLLFDPGNRLVLANEVAFEGRSPTAEDSIRVGMADTSDNDRWIDLGGSLAWNWQQGCMLQWVPGTDSEVAWNDRQDGRFVCHILDVKSGRKRTLPHPFYCLSPDGKTGFAPDFRRLNDTRPGYGYAGIVVAALARLNPVAVIFVAILIGGITNAGYSLQGADFPSGLVGILEGLILFCTLGGEVLTRYRIVRTDRRPAGVTGMEVA